MNIVKHKRLIGNFGIAAVLILLFVFDRFSYFEHKLQDSIYQDPGLTDPSIAVIGIDEKSLEKLGRFQQWSRQTMADAINILNSDEENKPAVIAVDILYVGESNDHVANANLVEAAKDGGNVVMASMATFSEDMSLNTIMSLHETPFPKLAEYVSYGLANGTMDESDSIVRQAILKAPFEGEMIYSFPCQIYAKYTGEPFDDFINTHTSAYLTYSGKPGDFSQGISFSDLFEDNFDPALFADSIVFIGPYASGLLDAYYTPVSADIQMYGVEIHANAVQMLLESNFKSYAPFLLNLAMLLIIILFIMLMARIVDIRVLLAIVVVMFAGYIFFVRWFFEHKDYILTIIYPLFTLAALYIYELVYGYVVERLEKQKVKSTFKKYVDHKLVDKLIESGEANSDEVGMKKHIAVLFVDVRGFTTMTEALQDQPELVVKILNEYLELTSCSVFDNGGSVDKFIGDATMALFNGFVPLDDYCFKAVKAAWDIVQGAQALNASIKEKYNVDIGFGVGVNCGEAIVGNLGPSFRKDYTAIGDTVNTAARLESNAKRSQVLISRQLYEMVKDRVQAESIGEIPLKGKSVKLEIFAVQNVIACDNIAKSYK